jgi:hypothetical protein
MWYRTSAMGAATLPKIIEEIIEAARGFYKPVEHSGDKCSKCSSELVNNNIANGEEFNKKIDEYKKSLFDIGLSESEVEKYLASFQSQMQEKNYCSNCKSYENPYMFEFDVYEMNKWLDSWRDSVRNRIMSDESLLGSYLANTKLTTEDKVIRIEKVTSDLRFEKNDDESFRGQYDYFLNVVKLNNKPINKREVDFYLETIKHELGHAFSLDKKHSVQNTVYYKQQTYDLFDRLMLDNNIQLKSLEELKKLDINQMKPSVEKRIKQVFGSEIIMEPGLTELIARCAKSILVHSKEDLMKKLDYSDEEKIRYAYYLYFTSPTETPTFMINMRAIFSADNLEKFRINKFRNISKQSYCNYIKDSIRNWNSRNILKFIDAASSSVTDHIYTSYDDIFDMMSIDDRPRIKKFIRQLQNNLVVLVNDYCSK